MKQDTIEKNYYNFSKYVTQERFTTYWYQVVEILKINPDSVLEIGIGTGVVKDIIRGQNINVKTVDINATLNPDYVADIKNLTAIFPNNTFDAVLCSRVLHHLPFSDFEVALDNMLAVTKKHIVLVLAADDFRLYVSTRLTGRRSRHLSLPIPLIVKKLILKLKGQKNDYYYNIWKLNSSSETDRERIDKTISRKCSIVGSYNIPTDHGHRLYILQKFDK